MDTTQPNCLGDYNFAQFVRNLIDTVQSQDEICIQIIEKIKAGIDVNGIDRVSGKTALIFAMEKKKYKVTEHLISFGADPMIMDKNGKSAYYYCGENSLFTIESILHNRFHDRFNITQGPLSKGNLEDLKRQVNDSMGRSDFNYTILISEMMHYIEQLGSSALLIYFVIMHRASQKNSRWQDSYKNFTYSFDYFVYIRVSQLLNETDYFYSDVLHKIYSIVVGKNFPNKANKKNNKKTKKSDLEKNSILFCLKNQSIMLIEIYLLFKNLIVITGVSKSINLDYALKNIIKSKDVYAKFLEFKSEIVQYININIQKISNIFNHNERIDRWSTFHIDEKVNFVECFYLRFAISKNIISNVKGQFPDKANNYFIYKSCDSLRLSNYAKTREKEISEWLAETDKKDKILIEEKKDRIRKAFSASDIGLGVGNDVVLAQTDLAQVNIENEYLRRWHLSETVWQESFMDETQCRSLAKKEKEWIAFNQERLIRSEWNLLTNLSRGKLLDDIRLLRQSEQNFDIRSNTIIRDWNKTELEWQVRSDFKELNISSLCHYQDRMTVKEQQSLSQLHADINDIRLIDQAFTAHSDELKTAWRKAEDHWKKPRFIEIPPKSPLLQYSDDLRALNYELSPLKVALFGGGVGDLLIDEKVCDFDIKITNYQSDSELGKHGFFIFDAKIGLLHTTYECLQHLRKIAPKLFNSERKVNFVLELGLQSDYLNTQLSYQGDNFVKEFMPGAYDAAISKQLYLISNEPDKHYHQNPISLLRGIHRIVDHNFTDHVNLSRYIKHFTPDNFNRIGKKWEYIHIKLQSYIKNRPLDFWRVAFSTGLVSQILFGQSVYIPYIEMNLASILSFLNNSGNIFYPDIVLAMFYYHYNYFSCLNHASNIKLNGFNQEVLYKQYRMISESCERREH